MVTQSSQQLADVLLHHWQNLWPLPPAERIKRIDEIRLDHEYERLLDDIALAVQEPEPAPEIIKPEPSNLLQFAAIVLFIGAGIAFAIIAATPVPA
jgi:hypothetical protein